MPTENENPSEVTEALTRLSIAMEKMEARYHASQRANRRMRLVLAIALLVVGAVAYQALAPLAGLLNLIPQSSQQRLGHEIIAKKRQQLLDSIPEETREKILVFEAEQQWMSGYLATAPNFNAAATVALFLAQMSQSMQVMPDMYAEVHAMKDQMLLMNASMGSIDGQIQSMSRDMRVMNANINVLPGLTAEIHGMNGKMGVMAAGMDSTMGRAGRMLPWP